MATGIGQRTGTTPTFDGMTEMTRADLLKGLGLAAVGVTLTTPTAHADAEHPNVRLIKDYYATYAKGDPEQPATTTMSPKT